MTKSAQKSESRKKRQFTALIANQDLEFREVVFDRPIVEADTVLRVAGLLPTLDHRLVELTFPGTRSLDDDETANIDGSTKVHFLAGRLDGLKSIAINEVPYYLPFEELGEPALRFIAGVSDDETLVIEKTNAPDETLNQNSVVSFVGPETERFYTQSRTVTVCVDGEREVEIERGIYQTTELLALLEIPASYAISFVSEAGNLIQVKPGETVVLFDGIKIFATPKCGGAS